MGGLQGAVARDPRRRREPEREGDAAEPARRAGAGQRLGWRRSVWIADDQGAAVLRVAPSTGKVVATVAVGDRPADMAFDASSGWVIDHRDRTLVRIDLATNTPTRIATVPGENAAPERMVLAGGSLWITGDRKSVV